jgi:drug/metabolite transporter (DMT)-like permease
MQHGTISAAAVAAVCAFAGNSLLCRLALRGGEAGPASFTLLRLASGAVVLAVLGILGRWPRHTGSWWPAWWLAWYAVAFAWAYAQLEAGIGALLLFGCVQLTMVGAAWWRREPMGWRYAVGASLAAAGVVWLVTPGTAAPSLPAAAAMASAGAAWGAYSLAGRGVADAAAATRVHFARALGLAVPLAAAVWFADTWTRTTTASGTLVSVSAGWPTVRGAILAVLSGAVTSALGYVVWYRAVRTMLASHAAALQLSVPVLTAAMAVPLLGERPTLRLAGAAALVLGGIGLTLQPRERTPIPR